MGALAGKVAVVTGAGRGIGRGEARFLAAEGACVVVNDLGGDFTGKGANSTPAQKVVDEIVADGGTAVANYSDVADWGGAEALVGQAVDTFGGLDILVNNAGFLRDRMAFSLDEADWDAVVRVHLRGHFAPIRFATAFWRAQSKAGSPVAGRIINTTSESGLFNNAGQSNYGAAKAGIASLTVILAREMQRYGVTSNAIAPRARTRLTESLAPDAPVDGFDELDPDNVAPIVGWLASDDAADVTGQVFVVGGGEVFRLGGWQVTGHVAQDHRWTIEELTTARADLFGSQPSGLSSILLAGQVEQH